MSKRKAVDGSGRKERDETTVCVWDLPHKATEDMLRRDFGAGAFLECSIATGSDKRKYGYVTFKKARQANHAIRDLNYTKVGGSTICVFRSDDETMNAVTSKVGCVVVKNLVSEMEPGRLHEMFSVFGEVILCKVPRDYRTGQIFGHGFVQFKHLGDAEAAIDGVKNGELGGGDMYAEMFCRQEEDEGHQSKRKDVKRPEYSTSNVVYSGVRYTREQLLDLYSPSLPMPDLFSLDSGYVCATPKAPFLLPVQVNPNRKKRPAVTQIDSAIETQGEVLLGETCSWFYIDDVDTVQGPFRPAVMQEWFQAGHLVPELMISTKEDPSSFSPLGECFPESELAFKYNPDLCPFMKAVPTTEDDVLAAIFAEMIQ